MIIKRETMTKVDVTELTTNESTVDLMAEYYDRRNDHGQILSRIQELYGYGIKSEPDPADSNKSIETYAQGTFETMLNAGMVEALSTGFGNKVVSARATLFTEPGGKFSLTHDSEDKDLKEAESLLHDQRKAGGHKSALVRADHMANQYGLSLIHI